MVFLNRASLKAKARKPLDAAGVAVLAAFAALRSAALNVYINAPMLRDRIFASQSMAEIDRLVASAAADSETVYTTVRGRL